MLKTTSSEKFKTTLSVKLSKNFSQIYESCSTEINASFCNENNPEIKKTYQQKSIKKSNVKGEYIFFEKE